jgi:DNA-binding NtrC family response regulator
MAVRTKTATRSPDGNSTLHILVSGPDVHTTIALPQVGRLVIGRDDNAHIRILDPRASRQHALLHVAGTIQVEDLGSTNGTRLGPNRLTANQPVPLTIGQALLIGNTTLVLQYEWVTSRTHAHGYLYDRLIEECARFEANSDSSFGFLRIHVGANTDSTTVSSEIAKFIRPGDMLALYAPCEFELLLPDSAQNKCEEIATNISQALKPLDTETQIGLAFFPRDGISPGALLAHACAQLRKSNMVAGGVLVKNPTMQALYQKAALVAKSNANVMVLGETGVGKEVLARTLHHESHRNKKPFIAINCAAFNETLLEDQLFGHERGAFNGADRARPGLLEAAHDGTLFLDEVGDMSPPMQAKLLRAVDCGEIIRLGSDNVRTIHVRFISATNRDLTDEIHHRRFRDDLYHRLAVVELRIPPLCERKDEIEPLLRRFLQELAQSNGRKVPDISEPALSLLLGYDWPGNVRELKNTIEQALALCPTDTITPEHLPTEKLVITSKPTKSPSSIPLIPAKANDDHTDDERQRILDALAKCAGNQTRAAQLLATTRFGLMRRLKELGIPRPRSN